MYPDIDIYIYYFLVSNWYIVSAKSYVIINTHSLRLNTLITLVFQEWQTGVSASEMHGVQRSSTFHIRRYLLFTL